MDHIKILKRSFDITRTYRMLWIFGIILALTTSGGRAPSGSGNQGGNQGSAFNPPPSFELPGNLNLPKDFHFPDITVLTQVAGALIAVGIFLACLALLLIVVAVIARYVSETALIRMVDRYEATSEKLGFRQGLRLGWSRSAFRIFLIDLLIILVVLAIMIPLMLIALLPLLAWTTHNTVVGVAGTIATVGMGMLIIFVGILAGIALSLLLHFFRRACILEERGVIDSIRRGFALVRQRPWDVILMGLLLFGIRLGWLILMILVVLLLVIMGLFLAGIPAALAGGIASLFSQGAIPWIVAAFVGGSIFIVIFVAPLLFLAGLMEVFKSSVWTLTYRELLALEKTKTDSAPSLAASVATEPVAVEPEASSETPAE
jgi:hypothetical protein